MPKSGDAEQQRLIEEIRKRDAATREAAEKLAREEEAKRKK